jgi:hypothetical protein
VTGHVGDCDGAAYIGGGAVGGAVARLASLVIHGAEMSSRGEAASE